MAKECTLGTGKLCPGGLPRNRVVWITDGPDMTSPVYCECKATNHTNKKQIMVNKDVEETVWMCIVVCVFVVCI